MRHCLPHAAPAAAGGRGGGSKPRTGAVIEHVSRSCRKPGQQPPKNRAVLLSGPPGIGKTSACHVILKEVGFDVIEFNASDVRSKNSVHAQIESMTRNRCETRLSLTFHCHCLFTAFAWCVSTVFVAKTLPFLAVLRSMGEFFQSGGLSKKRVALIMDEVDGMSSGDRGGMQVAGPQSSGPPSDLQAPQLRQALTAARQCPRCRN